MKHISALALALLLLLSACAPNAPAENNAPPADPPAADQAPSQEETPPATPQEPEAPPEPPDPRQEAIDAILASMTMEEKVGQMFFVRCPA